MALYTQKSYFSPFFHKQKLGLMIARMMNIIISVEQMVGVEVEKVEGKTDMVVVLDQWLVVVKVQEVKGWMDVKERVQVQQQLRA